jgi:hypothetical protein
MQIHAQLSNDAILCTLTSKLILRHCVYISEFYEVSKLFFQDM